MKLTRRRKVVLSLVGLAACCVGYLVASRMLGVSTADAAQITVGMSLANVEAILGPSPNDERTILSSNYGWNRWEVADGYVQVGFDSDTRVIGVKTDVVPVWERLYDSALQKLELLRAPPSSF